VVSNLTLACEKCNQLKGARILTYSSLTKPDFVKHILNQAHKPSSDAAVNTTRIALLKVLLATGLPVETGSGANSEPIQPLSL